MLVAIRPPRPFGNTSASKIRARWRTACKSLTVSPSASEEGSSSTFCAFCSAAWAAGCRFERRLEIALQILDRQLELEAVQLLSELCLPLFYRTRDRGSRKDQQRWDQQEVQEPQRPRDRNGLACSRDLRRRRKWRDAGPGSGRCGDRDPSDRREHRSGAGCLAVRARRRVGRVPARALPAQGRLRAHPGS